MMNNGNGNGNKGGSFFSNQARNTLDEEVRKRHGRASLVRTMQSDKAKRRQARFLDWQAEWQKYWYVYVFLVVSSLFTTTLGLYMGLDPSLDLATGVLYVHLDAGHIILAILYAVAFVSVTEVAFGIAKWLLHIREEDNLPQFISMIGMMVIAGVSIVATGIAGGSVIASQISFMTDYADIPEATQKWIITAIPVLIAVYTFMLTIYGLSSSAASMERMLRESERQEELDHRTRMKTMEHIAQEQLDMAELQQYMMLVEQGKMTAAQARAAIRAGRTLSQVEVDHNTDYNQDGHIGPAALPMPAMPRGPLTREPVFQQNTRAAAVTPTPVSRVYTLNDLLAHLGLSAEEARSKLDGYPADDAWKYLRGAGVLPNDLTHKNFNQLHAELVGSPH